MFAIKLDPKTGRRALEIAGPTIAEFLNREGSNALAHTMATIMSLNVARLAADSGAISPKAAILTVCAVVHEKTGLSTLDSLAFVLAVLRALIEQDKADEAQQEQTPDDEAEDHEAASPYAPAGASDQAEPV